MKAAGYVLDTNICAFYLRGKYSLDKCIDRVGWDNCYISEIRLRLAGTPCDDNFDLLIGCTSIAYNFVCVTDNTKHFENFKGISLENWIVRDR